MCFAVIKLMWDSLTAAQLVARMLQCLENGGVPMRLCQPARFCFLGGTVSNIRASQLCCDSLCRAPSRTAALLLFFNMQPGSALLRQACPSVAARMVASLLCFSIVPGSALLTQACPPSAAMPTRGDRTCCCPVSICLALVLGTSCPPQPCRVPMRAFALLPPLSAGPGGGLSSMVVYLNLERCPS